MRQVIPFALVSLVCLLLTGCGLSESAIVGKWVVDEEATKKSIAEAVKRSKGNATDEEVKMATEMITGIASAMTLEFKADKTVALPMVGQGTWSIDGSNVVVESGGTKRIATYRSGLLYLQPDPGEKEKIEIVMKKA
ncbi:MAG: hypothetical protein QM770_13000 [Tepidisphaeraceae bacterium]